MTINHNIYLKSNLYNQEKMKYSNSNTPVSPVLINNSFDLYNLSYKEIKDTKLYNFKGDYFNSIYNEALQIEKSKIDIKDIPLTMHGLQIDEIELEMEYQTEV